MVVMGESHVLSNTHTHTHTHIYIYIHTYIYTHSGKSRPIIMGEPN